MSAVLAAAARPAFMPDVMLVPDEQCEPSLPLASEGVRRWVWHCRFGAMLIEVIGAQVFVNGERVEPHSP